MVHFPFSEGCHKLLQFLSYLKWGALGFTTIWPLGFAAALLLQEAAPKSTKVTEETVEPKEEPKETKVDDDARVQGVNCYRLGLNFCKKLQSL